MEKIVIPANRRTVTGKQVKQLRRQGFLPAVIYGFEMEPTPITLNHHDASKVLMHLPGSTLITINVDGVEHNVLVREKQMDYIRNSLTHVDFQSVSLNKKIRADVAVEVTGTSPAVKDYNGIVMHNLNMLHVEALPQDLPERFVVDVTRLANIGDAIYVRDITPPSGVEIHTPGDEVVVVITGAAPEIEEVETAAEAAEPEVIERGKKEEEEEE